jgi:hypothetical protein
VIFADFDQIKLHAFACDGVTHHLFQPYGTDCLGNPGDREMMDQVNADDSLRSKFTALSTQENE